MKKFDGMSSLMAAVLATGGFAAMAMAQDECSTAIVATTAAPTAFNTATATASADAIPTDAQCAGTFLSWQAGQKDVWLKYTPTEGGTATFSTCLVGSYDTSMAIYTGTCGALTQVACNGDGPTDGGCQNYYSIVSNLTVAAGTTYYVRMGGYAGATGAGQLTITFTPNAAGCGTGGSCGAVHAAPGCNDGVCCTAVCASNPLCCEIGWDQSCVDAAVAACGIFVYTCNQGTPANDCATNAVVVNTDGVRSFSNVGAIQDGPNYGTTCGSGNNSSNNDVWWRVPAVANGTLTVSTCGTTPFDSKIAIYDMGTSPSTYDYNTLNTSIMGCNDDGNSGSCMLTDGVTPYASELSVTVAVGHSYLVNLSTYTAGETGAGQISFNVPEPCSLPSTTSSEGEACGSSTNAGCVNNVSTTTAIALGASVGGTFWADAGTRDVDWYSFTLTSGKTVTASVFSASNAAGFLFKGDSCSAQFIGQIANSCPATGSWCLPAGTYTFAVATAGFTGTPCGSGVFNNYVLQLNGVNATCPSFGDTCSYNIGTTVSQNTDSVITNYAFGCWLYCGTNESTFSTATNFARSFAGLNSGNLGCVTVGVSNMDENTDGTLANGAPVTITLGLYRDTDGGNPTTVGGDLQLITQKSFTALGGFGLLTWNLDAPLSLTGNTQPLVVVMSAPIRGGCSPATNGISGGVGNNTGSSAPWFEQSIDPNNICNDAAFVAQTGTSQWIVNLGMVAAPSCPTDINHDGVTGSADLAGLLNGWGTSSPDLNGDGTVGSADLSTLLNAWGACP